MNLFDLYAKITLDTGDYEKNLDDAAGKTVSFGDILKSNFVATAIVDGVKAIAGAVKNMAGEFISSAASIKAETSQFNQTFGEFRDQASDAIGRVADESGILQTRLNTLGSKIFAFARSSGGEVDESMSLMERALRAAADSAAYYDTSVEDATETLQSFLKGNFENDAALGLSATETTRNAAAMELFGQKYNDLTEIQKQETLLKMVEDSQRLSGAMGQASREADGWENVMGNLNEVLRQFQAKIGAPVLENLIPIVKDVTAGFQGWMNNIDWDGFGESIGSFVTMIIDNGPTIISLISGIATGLIAWNVISMIQGVVTAIKSFKAANEGATVAQLLLNAAMNANPIAIVISVVLALVAAIVTLWATNEDFREAVIDIWESIKNTFSDAWEGIKEVWAKVKPYFEGIWEGIKEAYSAVVSVLSGYFSSAWEGIKSVWNFAVDYFTTVWNTISGIFAVVQDVLSGDFQGAWEEIQKIFEDWGSFFSGLWDTVCGIFNGAMDFFSEIGGYIVDGIKNGISAAWNGLVEWFNGIWDSLFGDRNVNVNVNKSTTISSNVSRAKVRYSQINGSHAGGLSYVPFDGYIAELHRGEMVVPRKEANAFRNGSQFGDINITVNGAQYRDEQALAQAIAEALQSMTDRKAAVYA